jgi:hypothetical protein
MKCSVKDCEREAIVKGMCGLHYHRFCRHGNPLKTIKAYRNPPHCSVDGCPLPVIAKGLCMNHYALNKRNGEPVRHKVFTGVYIKDGYRYVMVGKRHYEPEHRVVMERFLHRKLNSDEHIHHIDKDTLNNSPSNLIVVSKSEHTKLHVKDRKRHKNGCLI